MVDLIIKENGEAILNRDVKKGEKISYQNSYLKDLDKIEYAQVIETVNKDNKLKAGHYTEGKPVIIANENTEDYLVVKIIK